MAPAGRSRDSSLARSVRSVSSTRSIRSRNSSIGAGQQRVASTANLPSSNRALQSSQMHGNSTALALNTSNDHILKTNAAFQTALSAYKAELTEQELARFVKTAEPFHNQPEMAIEHMKELDRVHAQKSVSRRITSRVAPLLRGVSQYFQMVGIMVQFDPSPSALIFGGIFCVVELALKFTAYFEKVIGMLQEVGAAMRPMSVYAIDLYSGNDTVQQALAGVYGDVLEICRKTSNVFLDKDGNPKSGMRTFGRLTWQPFEVTFDGLLSKFRSHLTIIESEARIAERLMNRAARSRVDAFQCRASDQLDYLVDETATKNEEEAWKKIRAIFRWLSNLSFDEELNTYLETRHPETCLWVLQSEAFKEWKESPDPDLLWIAGKPGSGKTILSSFIIDHLRAECQATENTLAFAYCDSRDDDRSDVRKIVASILRQLFEGFPAASPKLAELYSRLDDGAKAPSLRELLALEAIGFIYAPSFYVVLDALDESSDVEKLAKFLESLSKKCKVIVVSRSENDVVQTHFTSKLRISLDSSILRTDVNVVVHSEVEKYSQAGRLAVRDPKLKEEIIDYMTTRADGMFLWVKMQMETMSEQTNAKEVRDALYTLPDGLDRVYERSLEIIKRQKKPWKKLAHKVLTWVLFSKRALKIEELVEGLAVEHWTSAIDPDAKVHDTSLITSCCADLVTVSAGGLVQTVHSSVQDFFEARIEVSFGGADYVLSKQLAEKEMARVCMTYLTFKVFEERVLNKDELAARLEEHKLLDYSAFHWSAHVIAAGEESMMEDIIKMASHKHIVQALHQVSFGFNSNADQWKAFEDIEFSLLVMLMQNNLWASTRRLASNSVADVLNAPDPVLLSTPLMGALNEPLAPIDMANALIGLGADIMSFDVFGCNALFYAVLRQREDLVSTLISKGAHLTGRTSAYDRDIAFSLGAELYNSDGRKRQLLLEQLDWTALHAAARWALLDTTQQLLSACDDVDVWTESFPSPLVAAAKGGNLEVVQILIEHKFDVNGPDAQGCTALIYACTLLTIDMAQTLLAAGAKANVQSEDGMTPLGEAIHYGRDDTVALLLDAGASISTEIGGKTAIHLAAELNRVAIAKLILAKRPDPDARISIDKYTALHGAASKGHIDIVKLLLEYGYDIEAEMLSGWTPLICSVVGGNLDLVRLLLDWGANDKAYGDLGLTAIHNATSRNRVDIAELLLDRGSDAHVYLASVQQTLLHVAATFGSSDVIPLLLERNLSIDATDKWGDTPLLVACEEGHAATVNLLLARNASVGIKNNDGISCLMRAILSGHMTIFQMLLDLTDNLDEEAKIGLTALHMAIDHDQQEMARILLERGANPWSLTVEGETAYERARQKGLYLNVSEPHVVTDSARQERILVMLVKFYNICTDQNWTQPVNSSVFKTWLSHLHTLLLTANDIVSAGRITEVWPLESCIFCKTSHSITGLIYKCKTCSEAYVCESCYKIYKDKMPHQYDTWREGSIQEYIADENIPAWMEQIGESIEADLGLKLDRKDGALQLALDDGQTTCSEQRPSSQQ